MSNQPTSSLLPPEIRKEYPFDGHFMPVTGGHRMHYLDEGSGPPVLMLHGNPTWSFYYRKMVLGLRDSYRCIVPDHIGCGLSDKPEHYGYRISDHVNNVVALATTLGIRDAALVVHDWGGAIGYSSLAKLKGVFRSFVVMNTAAFLLPLPRLLTMFRLPRVGSFGVRRLNGMLRLGLLTMVAQPGKFRGPVRDGYLWPYRTYEDRVAIDRFVQEIPIEQDHPNRALLSELEGTVREASSLPHLILWGKKDFVFHPGYLAKWKEVCPSAEVHEFDNASHWVLEEESERIVPLVKTFLDKHLARG